MRRHLLLVVALCILLAVPAASQLHPNLERGATIGKSYQVGDIDSVALFNGALSIAIPLGQTYSAGGDLTYSFVLRYNSNFWDHNLVTFTNDCFLPYGEITVTQATPQQFDSGLNGGLGWSLNFGTLLLSGFGTTDDRWTYIAPDGSTHPFSTTMHEGETPRAGYRYSRDGSYMRLVASSYSPGATCAPGWLAATVEFADGRRQTFSRLTTCHPFVLSSEIDRYDNSLTFTYDATSDRLVIHDSQGRDHYVYFESRIGTSYRVISSLELAAFDDPATPGQQRATYLFNYSDQTLGRSCKHYYDSWWDNCDPQLDPTFSAPFLTAITRPDGSQWTMLNGSAPGYNLDPASACDTIEDFPQDQPGTITNLKTPTGGTYAWTYAQWFNPEGGASCYSSPYEQSNVKEATGVSFRTLTDPIASSGGGQWHYVHDSWHVGDPNTPVDPTAQESWTTVTTPENDESKHYFRTQYCGAAYEGWDYGLPFTRGRFGTGTEPYLSVQQYDGVSTNPTNLKRTSFLRYGKDTLNASWPPPTLQMSNRRVEFQKTVFADDANHYTTVDSSDFDGAGHFRVVMTGGDFGVSRQTITAYNPGKNYPPGTPPAEWWPYSSPWIINTYTSSKVVEGGNIAKQEACFDATTGYLLRTRALRLTGTGGTDPAPNATDVISRRTHTAGNTTREEWFGGDTQAVPTTALCGLTLPTATYRIEHTYQYGALKTSGYYDSSGSPLSFLLVDRDIDPSTGLTATSRDSAGVATTFVYDTMGRLTWELPQTAPVNGGALVQHCYSAAAPPTPAKVRNYWWANSTTPLPACGSTAATLDRYDLEVDGFGRALLEYRKIFDGTWAQRITAYNGMGWKTSVSEWQALNPTTVYKTEYLNFDPFGRARTIRPPDGSAHEVTLAYSGVRKVERTVTIATAQGTESGVTSTEEFDRQGRLYKVEEYSDPANPATYVATTYSYDVGSRLKQASTTSGVTQNRIFTYDNRGFLLFEDLPEKVIPAVLSGDSRHGTECANHDVCYARYDARGHAGQVQDGSQNLAYTFDPAERLTQVSQATNAGLPTTPTLTTLVYATSNNGTDLRKSKLHTATSANPDLASASVVETYAYAQTGGRVSSRQTQVEGHTVTQSFTWNDLGQLAAVGYPDSNLLNNTSQEPTRSVTYSYTNGFLTAVPSYVSAISYHANGMVKQLTHANSTKVVHGKDPFDMARPASISLQRTSDSSTLWQTGTYAYDGAGNIKTIGSDWYTYDKVNRLSVGTSSAAAKRQCMGYNAFGAITALGTGTSTCTPSGISVDGSTNRLTETPGPPAVSYDAAGNMTAWGGYQYSWNRLHQMLTATGPSINRSYGYTADGERAVDRNNQDSTRTVWIRDLSGKVLREYSRTSGGTWSWSKDYVYRDGLHVASVEPPFASPVVRHFALDHLGTLRRASDTQATPQLVAALTRDFYPFGMEATSATGAERMRFTGHQRDTFGTTAQTDDLDYLHARCYNPNVARFLSVDPGRDNNPKVPQSWNLYAYVQNNPINKVDPDGKLAMLVATTNYVALNTVVNDAVKNVLTPVLGLNLSNKLANLVAPKEPAQAMTTAAMGLATPLAAVGAKAAAPVVQNAAGQVIKNPWNAFQSLVAGRGFSTTQVRQAYQAAKQFGVWPTQVAGTEMRAMTDDAMAMAGIEAGAQRAEALLNAGTGVDAAAPLVTVVVQRVKDWVSGIFGK